MSAHSPAILLEGLADAEERCAVQEFFQNYVLIPRNPQISRGYFYGLYLLLQQCGWESGLGKATKAAAFASKAGILGDGSLRDKAHAIYYRVLQAFQSILGDAGKCNSDEALMTAAMLGLYEVRVLTHVSLSSSCAKGGSDDFCHRGDPKR